MIEAFSTPRSRITTLILLAVCILSAIAAALAGIDDNPPGVLLAYLAAIALVLAFVHPWRSVKQFRSLLLWSVIGMALFVALNNVFAYFGHSSTTTAGLQNALQGLAVVSFLLATMICPAAIIVGAAGWAVMAVRSR